MKFDLPTMIKPVHFHLQSLPFLPHYNALFLYFALKHNCFLKFLFLMGSNPFLVLWCHYFWFYICFWFQHISGPNILDFLLPSISRSQNSTPSFLRLLQPLFLVGKHKMTSSLKLRPVLSILNNGSYRRPKKSSIKL